MHSIQLGLVVLTTLLSTLTALPAEACSPACEGAVRVYRVACVSEDSGCPLISVPGNLVYFKVLEEGQGSLSLQTADGTVVAASTRTIGSDLVFAPDEPIAPGTKLVLTYPSRCEGNEEEEFNFETGAHVVDPPAPLTLNASPGRSSTQHFEVEAPPGYAHLVDRVVASLGDHDVIVWGSPNLGTATFDLGVASRCGAESDGEESSCGGRWTFSRGQYPLSVRRFIVGQNVLAPRFRRTSAPMTPAAPTANG